MGQEEQIEEREVLASIFPDEITDISENSYRVAITLDNPREDGDDTEPPTILLTVSYPPTYPDDAPSLTLSSPPNSPKHPLFDLSASKPQLLALLPPLIAASLGSAMIFTLISAVKDGAETLMAERVAAARAEIDRQKRREEDDEAAKFSGARVTRDSFGAWRSAWREERAREDERRAEGEGEGKRKGEGKVTGRELWEKGLVGRVEEGEDEDVGEGGKVLG